MIRATCLVLSACLLAGCGGFAYYAQAVRGHLDLMSRRVPIGEVIADPQTPAAVRQRLEVARQARQFAVEELGLPDNGSYTRYVALERSAAVWNVFAAPRFSLEAKRWCFPVAGCVVYRGYFDEADARAYAAGLAEAGWDTWVGGATAYSTLGRFEDPVLSTMMAWGEVQLAATLFHELAHQRLYVEDDSAFNEAFATVVEQEGLRRWLAAPGRQEEAAAWRRRQAFISEFQALLDATRGRLAELYASGRPPEAMAAGKQAAFEQLEADYRQLRARWNWSGYDRWFDAPLNNARLIPSATYRGLVPAFEALLSASGGDLPVFFQRCRELAELDQEVRGNRLRALAESAGKAVSSAGAPR
ncbi:MAG: aminopeptidase [Gammaproteobacteria bacterium]